MPNPRDHRATSVAGVPIIVVRGEDGVVRTLLNACRHRGAAVCDEGKGTTTRFLCKYHAWRYDLTGRLAAVTDRSKFGTLDLQSHSLVELPCVERHGFIWACLTPGLTFDIETWLGGMGAQLDSLELTNWYIYDQREIAGPGWKVAWDGYLEAYHHQTVHVSTLDGKPENEWESQDHLRLIHSVFPSLSVSGILGDHCLVTQLFPGPTHEASITRQTILSARKPETDAEKSKTEAFSHLALSAVRDEDCAVTATILAALNGPGNSVFTFGRNEPAIQHYHRWVERVVADESPATLPGRAHQTFKVRPAIRGGPLSSTVKLLHEAFQNQNLTVPSIP